MPATKDLTEDDTKVWALLDAAEQQYADYLEVAQIASIAVEQVEESPDYGVSPAPLTFAFRSFG